MKAFSQSMRPSAEELKAMAGSGQSLADSRYSPAVSMSNLKEQLRARASMPIIHEHSPGASAASIAAVPASFPLPAVTSARPAAGAGALHGATGGNTHVGLRTTSQVVNGLIQRDKLVPDLGELLSGQFSREYAYGDESRPILQFNRLSVIPEVLLAHVRQSGEEGRCFMGLFPEIHRAWLTAGNALYLWSFENNRDFTCYTKSQHDIIDVALVKPRPAVFVDEIEHLVVVVTPLEITLLGVSFDSAEPLAKFGSTRRIEGRGTATVRNYAMRDLVLHETDLRFPSDEINMVSVCGTQDGRIFLAGSDGNIYELVYQAKSDWLTAKCRKINRTSTPLSYIVPTFLKLSSNRTRVVKLVHDGSRNILYGLTEQSAIQIYWLGPKGADFEFVSVMGDVSGEVSRLAPAGVVSSSKSLEIVSIHPVDAAESEHISLVVVCRSGIRLYFATLTHMHDMNFGMTHPSPNVADGRTPAAPRGLRLVHIRAPPEENRVRDPKKLVHRWSPNLHCALYANGVLLAANSISAEEDLVIGMIMNPAVVSPSSLSRPPLEYSVETQIDGKVWAIEELGTVSSDSAPKGIQKEFTMAHLVPRRSFAVLTNVGVYVLSKLRPIDQLYLLLVERNMNWTLLEQFFDTYGPDQACMFCIALCCGRGGGNSGPDHADMSHGVFSNAIAVLLKLGGDPRLLDQSTLSGRAANEYSALGARAGIGRIIATQPEFENSPMHDGFYVYFSRLVATLWRQSLWDTHAVPGTLLADLHRLFTFMSDNMVLFTEKRTRVGTFGHESRVTEQSGDEIACRQQAALACENESLVHLRDTTALLIELLAFLSICADYRLLELVRSEPIGREHAGMDIESLLTTLRGKSLIKELGNILVQHQLKQRAPVRPLCESLRQRCPAFFSEEDVILQEGIEALERARQCRSPAERMETLVEALAALIKACRVIPVSNLLLIFDQLDRLGFQDGALRLGLKYIEAMDPEGVGLALAKNPDMQLDADQHEIVHQRDAIYARMMESIGSTGFVADRTNLVVASNPGLDIDALRAKCLTLSAASRDELFHFRFYDWLVLMHFTATLLDLPPSEFLRRYLRTTFLARFETHRDLLWKWLAKTGRHLEAASVLAAIAESREYTLRLAERIEYLSLAVAHCKSSSGRGTTGAIPVMSMAESDIAPAELPELEERMEVAQLQLELLNDMSLVRGSRDAVCSELDGPVGLLSVSEMFNQYARPYRMTESCLKIVHVSGLVNDRLVAQLWQDIVSEQLGCGADTSRADVAGFQRLGGKIAELGRRFYPSPFALPLVHLIDVFGRLALSAGVEAGWLVAAFINADIPLSVLSDELHRFVSNPPSKSWLGPALKTFMLEMLVILYGTWMDGAANSASLRQVGAAAVSRLRLYINAAEEVQSAALVSEFGIMMQKIVASR